MLIVRQHELCPAHPDGLHHECMEAERRCVYCGALLRVKPCNGCGRFLSNKELRENASRCDRCF